MKPNLFRSIYNALGEQFPLLPRIRRAFWGLLMFCVMFLLVGLSSETISIPVKATGGIHYIDQPTLKYTNIVVMPGRLTISDPTFQEIILLQTFGGVDMITLIFLGIGSCIIIWMTPKLYQQNFFRKDISNAIRAIGYLMILHGIVSILRTNYYAPLIAEKITRNEFTSEVSFPVMICAEWYFSLIVIAMGGMYERGMKLQQEQDLTV